MRYLRLCGVVSFALLAAFLVTSTISYAKTPFAEGGVVRQKCSVCHRLDQQGRVEVIEETRKTPEEWYSVVARMRRINGAPIEDAEVKAVVKELSEHLILTPAEMAKCFYYTTDENSHFRERSSLMKTDLDKRIFQACVRCHAYGKIISHRKTEAQWVENMNMHLGYYPTVVPQMREMDWPKEAMELAKILAKEFPMDSPEVKAWYDARKPQDLSGKWIVAGYQPGAGYYEGTYTFKPNAKAGKDEYLIERQVQYENGMTLKQVGEGTLYGTYHLRYALQPTSFTGRVEGVFNLDAAVKGFTGRWWTVVQDTNAFGDEAFYKSDAPARVFAIFPQAIKSGGTPQTVRMIGVNLPAATEVTFGDANVKAKVKSATPNKLTVEVTAAAGAAIGSTAVQVKGAACNESVVVYNKLDGIKVLPELGRAYMYGGAAYPPQGVQFVARGLCFGKDGKEGTEDDLLLEPVNAQWTLEQDKVWAADNPDRAAMAAEDLKCLAAPIDNGLYSPPPDRVNMAPNEWRVSRREGVGLIAVVATYKEGGKEFKGQALLGVSPPDYVTHIK
jgi:quinohemoprotein amine dehydrogenase